MIGIHPLTRVPEIAPGDNLARLLGDALRAGGLAIQENDILVVTQKIVSKAEGRFIRLADVKPGAEALRLAAQTGKDPRLVEIVLAESVGIVRAAGPVLITRHRSGLVMANAGVDRSNLGPGREESALLLPLDPDASARRIADGLATQFGRAPGVIISDSFGRPWRLGVVNVAIGAAGAPVLLDYRGRLDRDGRKLEVTQIATADLIASAAGLAMGESAEGVPAALLRGYRFSDEGPDAASTLVRPLQEDLFR
jgi:coenzyme F420-0:L-glutamate ligase / coenzyme F420-1:gamma-L-glutamate ligase